MPLAGGPPTAAGPSPRHPPLPPPVRPPPRLAPSFPCSDTGIHAPYGRTAHHGWTLATTPAAPPAPVRPPPRLAPSFPCPDTGIHAPCGRTAHHGWTLAATPAAPPAPVRPPPPRGGLRWGQPRALGPRGDPRCDIRPSPQPLPTPTMAVEACPEPVEEGPRDPAQWRPAPPARFTSECRKMSQNVALFRPSTRKPPTLTSEKPHVLGPFPAILANFRSIPSHPPSFPCPDTGIHAPSRRVVGAHLATLACNPSSPPVRRRARAPRPGAAARRAAPGHGTRHAPAGAAPGLLRRAPVAGRTPRRCGGRAHAGQLDGV